MYIYILVISHFCFEVKILVRVVLVPGHCLFLTFMDHGVWTYKSNRKAMNRNWCNQKTNPALKTKTGNK